MVEWGDIDKGTEFLVGVIKNFWKKIPVMVA